MGFQPINDRILVELVHEDEVTPGGIIKPETAREVPMRAIVAYVGEGGYTPDGVFRKTQLSVGDEILIPKYAGSAISLDGRPYVVLLESDVFGKVIADQKQDAASV